MTCSKKIRASFANGSAKRVLRVIREGKISTHENFGREKSLWNSKGVSERDAVRFILFPRGFLRTEKERKRERDPRESTQQQRARALEHELLSPRSGKKV